VLHDIADALRCPHCTAPLSLDADGRTLRCTGRHTFDVARQGYTSLLAGDAKTGTADTPDMVAARDAFLGAGHYAPISDAVTHAVTDAVRAAVDDPAGGDGVPGHIADVGAGTGYYLARVLDALPERAGIALDISKHALRRAARAHARIGAVVCDAWQPLPVRDHAAAAILNVFAPRNPAELHRILHPAGRLVVVTPNAGHLAEPVARLGLLRVDSDKKARLDAALADHFTPAGDTRVAFTAPLAHTDVATVVGMGPSAWHTDPAELRDRIAALPEPWPVSVDVTVSIYSPRAHLDTRDARHNALASNRIVTHNRGPITSE
jgi:23S rRNA (guanine745-N1)-methyltransferase